MSRGTLRTLLAVAVLAGLAFGAVYPAPAHAAPIPLATFAAKLDSALGVVKEAGSSVTSQSVAAAVAMQVETLLPLGQEVAEGTATITVADNVAVHRLTGDLRTATTASARTEAADALLDHLDSMRSALGLAGTAPWDAATLQSLLAERPVTTDGGGNWLGEQVTRILEAITKWLDSLTGASAGARPFAPSRLIPVVAIGVPVVIALWILGRALVRRRRRSPKARAAEGATDAGPVVAAAADLPDDPLSFAERLASEGRHRDAVRALYGGAARHLVEEGLVARMRTRTNHEMLRDVRDAAPALAPAFGRLTDEFEIAWYGHADPGGGGFEQARVTYEALLGSVESGERSDATAGERADGRAR